MEHLWTWGGNYFGYRDGDDLWTYDGYHVGHFIDDIVFNLRGQYLGELMNENRLVRKPNSSMRGYTVTPWAKRAAYARYANYAPFVKLAGYEDFPKPEDLR